MVTLVTTSEFQMKMTFDDNFMTTQNENRMTFDDSFFIPQDEVE